MTNDITQPIPTSLLAGKTALVTGGGRGIGRAISLQLARKFIANLAITYVADQAAAESVVAECVRLGAEKVVALRADVLDANVGPKLIAEVLEAFETSTIDIVVNNAAFVDSRVVEPFEQLTPFGFSSLMQGNVFSAMSIIRATLPHLPPRNGRIINISSIYSRDASPEPLITYGATKAALDSITRSLAVAHGVDKKATFNSVSIGTTQTDTLKNAIKADVLPVGFIDRQIARSSAEARLGEPEDVGLIVAWLASDESRWINGASIPCNGGDKMLLGAQG